MAEGKRSRKFGRGEAKGAAYRNAHTREKNKLKRIRKSNGWEAGLSAAREYKMTGYYTSKYPEPVVVEVRNF